ncbi:hypothetical protein, partial [Bradyrhizobium sp.]|uniref:hypothetical protein n=1 Tax=Bradyrhizobium sp. TaxID=376 RepID=UPI003C52135D
MLRLDIFSAAARLAPVDPVSTENLLLEQVAPYCSASLSRPGIKAGLRNSATQQSKMLQAAKTKTKNVKEMSILTINSIDSIIFKFLPVIEPYSHYMFWKIDQYNLMYSVAKLVMANAHHTLYG